MRGKRLHDINATLEALTKGLCEDKGTEKAINRMLADGVDPSQEDLAYDGGSLRRLERAIYALSEKVETLPKKE